MCLYLQEFLMVNCMEDEEQDGLRKRRGHVDQIIALRQVMEKTCRKRRVYTAFIDLERAYNNSRDLLRVDMQKYAWKNYSLLLRALIMELMFV